MRGVCGAVVIGLMVGAGMARAQGYSSQQNSQPLPPSGSTGYYAPVHPQAYQRRCGTVATDICKVPVTVPAGATAEQIFAMGERAEANRQKGEAISYYEKAAELGYPLAETIVGRAYLSGRGETRDVSTALLWLERAANSGESGAQASLGAMYERGNGVEENQTRAAKYYRLAAEQGEKTAAFNLGLDYEFGRGVDHNRALAMQWLRRSSADGGDPVGSQMASALAKAGPARRFTSIDEIAAFAHPVPPPAKAGSCPANAQINTTGTRAAATQYLFCQQHPGCTLSTPGFPNYVCPR